MTYVRVKLRLEVLQPGQTLEVLLRGEEPLRNVPRAATAEGHEVLSVQPLDGDAARLLLRRGAGAARLALAGPAAGGRVDPLALGARVPER